MSGYHSGSYPPIQPAAISSPPGGGPPDNSEAGPISNRRNVPRRQVTAVACNVCKTRKSKCDGLRPVCTACRNRNTPENCVFDASMDQRRTAALKEQLKESREEAADLKRILTSANTIEGQQRYGPLLDQLIDNKFPTVDLSRMASFIEQGLDPTEFAMTHHERAATSVNEDMDGVEPPPMDSQQWQDMSPVTGANPTSYGQEMQMTGGVGPYGEGPSNLRGGQRLSDPRQRQHYEPNPSDRNS